MIVTLKQWMYIAGLHIAIMKASPVLNYGLLLAFSLLEACLSLAASILPPKSCSYLSMTFWFPGLDPWSSVCFSLNSPIDSYCLGSGYTLKTPCPSWLRISYCKIHKEIQGQKASLSPNQIPVLCVGMFLFHVMPLKLQLWYPSPFLLLPSLSIFHLNSSSS